MLAPANRSVADKSNGPSVLPTATCVSKAVSSFGVKGEALAGLILKSSQTSELRVGREPQAQVVQIRQVLCQSVLAGRLQRTCHLAEADLDSHCDHLAPLDKENGHLAIAFGFHQLSRVNERD
ncbi:unnamed protein product [Protopolystoma xenopodis]|uniref:Uncharacterized protein n=1 Tax=Protopolystoma xenopodis TaxID=117903 RepID=A0A3S5BWA9_9PLAT|nr:unnamed protein product [Protopolystoma xenopodis]